MPSPFPGMDPYLEHPRCWGTVHHALITDMWRSLNARLPAGFTAAIGERLYVVHHERPIYPDVALLQHPVSPAHRSQTNGGVAVAPDPPVTLTVQDEEVREGFIVIRRTRGPGEVVSMIELLSPNKKMPGEQGRDLYLAEQAAARNSGVHLLEIDLLQGGQYTVAAPPALQRAGDAWTYIVSLHRAGEGGKYSAWPFGLTQRLPRVSVPLAPDLPDIVLELQLMLDRCYVDGRFHESIDYTAEPPVALRPADAAWADALLREKGIRR